MLQVDSKRNSLTQSYGLKRMGLGQCSEILMSFLEQSRDFCDVSFSPPAPTGEDCCKFSRAAVSISFIRRVTLIVRSGPVQEMGEAPEQNGSLKDVISGRATRLLPMRAKIFQGVISDKKAELERRYVELLEKRVAALEALIPNSVRPIGFFLRANELSVPRPKQKVMPRKRAIQL